MYKLALIWIGVSLFLSISGNLQTHVMAGDWNRTVAAESHWFNDLRPDGMALGSDSSVHMAYGKGRLYYRKHGSGGVTMEVADPAPGTGGSAVIALNNANEPMIAYQDRNLSAVKFAWKDAGTWQIMQLDTGESIGQYISIASDTQGNPHVVYSDQFHNDFVYTYRDTGGSWHSEIIDAVRFGLCCDLVLYNDQPRVAYMDVGSLDLVVSYRTGAGWQRYVNSTADWDGYHCTLDVDSVGNIFVVYYNQNDTAVNMVRFDGLSFGTVYTVDSATVAGHMDMEIDTDGYLHIIYGDTSIHECRVAYGIYSAWAIQTVDTADGTGRCVSISVQSPGSSYVRFMNYESDLLYLGWGNISMGWDSESIDESFSTGVNTRMKLDSTGNPWSIFNDYPGFDTHYVVNTGAGWQMDAFPMTENIPAEYDFAVFPDGRILAVSGSTDPHIRAHYFDGTAWYNENIKLLTGLASHLNLAVASDGTIHIACRNSGSSKIIHLESPFWNGSYTLREIGDTSADKDCKIALDSLDEPHIIFGDAGDDSLKHAWRTGGDTWHEEVMASFSGNWLNMVLDSGDRVYATINGTLVSDFYIVIPAGTGYSVDPFPETYTVLPGAMFALTADDQPSVAYTIGGNFELRYAEYDGANWEFQAPLGTEGVQFICMVQSPVTGITIGCKSDLTGDYLMVTQGTGVQYNLMLNDTMFTPGEPFALSHQTGNFTPSDITVDEYIILDVLGMYWFWPSWSEAPDFLTHTVPAGTDAIEDILSFTWPSGAGSFEPIYFWGGILHAGTVELIQYDYVEWGYGE